MGDEGGYTWSQKGDEVQVLFKLPKAVTKKDVKVGFKSASLSVAVSGDALLDGGLGGKVDTDDCTWCLASGGTELQVKLRVCPRRLSGGVLKLPGASTLCCELRGAVSLTMVVVSQTLSPCMRA